MVNIDLFDDDNSALLESESLLTEELNLCWRTYRWRAVTEAKIGQ